MLPNLLLGLVHEASEVFFDGIEHLLAIAQLLGSKASEAFDVRVQPHNDAREVDIRCNDGETSVFIRTTAIIMAMLVDLQLKIESQEF